jgi:hypothetical protein
MSRLLFTFFAAVVALDAGTTYQIDNGSADTSLGITPNSSSMLWMNEFTAGANGNDIYAIDIVLGRLSAGSNMTNGAPITLYIWSDPGNGGNPSNAVVLASVSGVTANVNTNTFTQYLIGPVVIPVGDDFFVGAAYTESGVQFPAAIDTSSESGRSWFRGFGPGLTPDPNAGDEVNLDGAVPGNFMIRAEGTAAVSEPREVLLAGAGLFLIGIFIRWKPLFLTQQRHIF